ncbi:DUF4202 family protein [Candidatus Woesearchaeota archaeon]|nr:DUF4202 family protein [Candidatus Woesearchaeota archaeon]
MGIRYLNHCLFPKGMLEKVIQYVDQVFGDAGKESNIPHFKRALYWLMQIRPDADEPTQIAAYAHDLERGLRKEASVERFRTMAFDDPGHLVPHQRRGAETIREFLQKQDYDPGKTEKVYGLVLHHEEGGDPDADAVMDADSISFFECNVQTFLGLVPKLGKQKIKDKFDYMYDRMAMSEAKQIAEPMYKKALKCLDET